MVRQRTALAQAGALTASRQDSAAALTSGAVRADTHDVLWLALIWVALIALWGASERWNLPGAGRRFVRTSHLRARSDEAPGD